VGDKDVIVTNEVVNSVNEHIKPTKVGQENSDKNSDTKKIMCSKEILDTMKQLLFGKEPVKDDVLRWKEQGFTFVESHKSSINFGLGQRKGGPCGVLAPMQAFLVVELLFKKKLKGKSDQPIILEEQVREKALIGCMADIIVKCTNTQEYVLATEIDSKDTFIAFEKCKSREMLEKSLTRHYEKTFSKDLGVLLYVYSIILTRGVKNILNDMDDNTQSLVQRFGHCSQELVNLMICGKAITNVFDGEKVLQGNYRLRGIPEQMDIGYLTLLEVLRYTSVGDFLKRPKHPVWVIGSQSHYTVLFGVDPNITFLSEEEKRIRQISFV